MSLDLSTPVIHPAIHPVIHPVLNQPIAHEFTTGQLLPLKETFFQKYRSSFVGAGVVGIIIVVVAIAVVLFVVLKKKKKSAPAFIGIQVLLNNNQPAGPVLSVGSDIILKYQSSGPFGHPVNWYINQPTTQPLLISTGNPTTLFKYLIPQIYS